MDLHTWARPGYTLSSGDYLAACTRLEVRFGPLYANFRLNWSSLI